MSVFIQTHVHWLQIPYTLILYRILAIALVKPFALASNNGKQDQGYSRLNEFDSVTAKV